MDKSLTREDVFDRSVEELRQELESLGQETSKTQLQNALAKLLSPLKSSNEEWRSKCKSLERKAAKEKDDSDREVELLKLKLKAETEAEERKLKAEAEAEERKIKAEIEAAERRLSAEADMRRERIHVEEEERRVRFKIEVDARQARLEVEERIARINAEDKEKKRQHGLRMRELELSVRKENDMNDFRIAAAVKIVPEFEEMEVEQFLLAFEQAMQIQKVAKAKWTALIHTKLTGKAQKVFSELTVEECQDYDILKKALLTAYSRVPEFYRKRFRTMIKGNMETYSNFAFRLSLCRAQLP